jgi:colanic acid biosynthesis glycosyl transferase WcaI
MRVLIISQLFDPEPDLKGLPMARQLQDRGHEVEVLTGFPNYPGGSLYPGYSLRPWTRGMVDGIPVRRLMLYPSHDRNGSRRALSYLSFGVSAALLGPWLTRRPDIVYVYNLVTLMPAARLISRLSGAKVVLDIQDLWPESVASSGMLRSGKALEWLHRWSNASYRAADQIVVLSPGFKENLIGRGIPADQVQVIYNWAAESAGPDAASYPMETQAPHGGGGGFEVLFAGTMGVMQGLDVVIEAARLLRNRAPDVRFTLVGSGVDQERLMKLGAGMENVRFLPRRPGSEMGVLFESADALLVHLKDDPLFRITIPSKIQAYLQAGRPILCGVQGDAADLVNQAGAGRTFRPEDAGDLSDAVLHLQAQTPAALREMGARGRRFYHEQLALACGVDRMESVFRRLAYGGISFGVPEMSGASGEENP